MADEAEDVLELDSGLEINEDLQTDGEGEEGDEIVIGFADEEAAPASETDSSVIRDLRKANRELAKKVAALDRASQPQKIELGPKPTLEDAGYDEETFEAQLDEWKDRKARIEQAERADQEQAEKAARDWQGVIEAYKADKTSLKVANFDAAEETVFAALSDQHQALIMRSGKGAQLVAALAASPTKLEDLSKLNLAEAAMMIGELRGKLQMGTRQTFSAERRVTGNAPVANGTDKELAKLEKEAERTGDRTALIRYRRKMASQG